MRLGPVEVAYYRDVLVEHADDLVTGVCAVCLTDRCPDWRNAYDRSTTAGVLMTAPERWQQSINADRKPSR